MKGIAYGLRVAVILGLIGSAFGVQTVPNLILYLKLDEAAGNSAADSSGNGFNGTWTNLTPGGGAACIAASVAGACAPLVPGNSRSVLLTHQTVGGQLDGSYVNIPSDPAFTFTGPFTAMAWIKPIAFAAGDNPNDTGAVIQKWDSPSNTVNGYGMNRDLSGSISFWMGDGTQSSILTTTGTTPVGQWSHIAIVFTGTGRQIFINGTQSASDNYTNLGASTQDLHVGKDNGARNFYGHVDEVRLYGRALGAGEVQSLFNSANTIIGVGNAGPVMPPHGLLGQYYNNNAGITVAMTPPGSPSATPSSTATLALTRLDAGVNFDWVNGSPATGVTADNFFGVWTGRVQATSNGGNYLFGTRSDDCTRIWVDGTLVLNHWANGQAAPANPDMGTTAVTMTAGSLHTIRLEYMEMAGQASSRLYWKEPTAASAVHIPPYHLLPPDGPNTPGNLTAVPSTTSATASVAVSWNASTSTPITGISYILSRATAPGGPFTQVAVQTGLSFTDAGVTFGTGYYYVIQATDMNGLLVGAASSVVGPATPKIPPVTVSPTSITTSESGGNATLTLTVNAVPNAAAQITISSSDVNQAVVSGQGNGDLTVQGPAQAITININSGTPIGTTFSITVFGVNDFIAQPANQSYTISFGVTGGGSNWATASLPNVSGTTLEGNSANFIVNPINGLVTDTGGRSATFAVQLNSKPANATPTVQVALTTSNPGEGLVTSSTLLRFDQSNWNVPQQVTVTGQATVLSYINTSYSVAVQASAGDPAYTSLAPVNVSIVNIHLEAPPSLPHVWGGGGGGGCGLLGLDAALLIGLLALLRRRR